MQPSITSNPSTKRPKLHPRGRQSVRASEEHHIHSQIIQERVYLPLRYSLFSVRVSGLVQLSRRACEGKKRYKSTAAHLEADLESAPTGLVERRGLKVAANGSKPNLKSRTLLLFGRALAAASCP